MALQEKLDAYKKQFEADAPQEVVALMHRAIDELRQSGIMERVLRVGARAPEFAIPNAQGEIIGSKNLLADRPLVLSFYRGVW